MTTKLREFISQLKTSGIAKLNRFSVILSPPVSVGGASQGLSKILLYCSSVNLPGITISSNQARIFGEVFEFPWEKLYPPCELTFYVDANMEVKKFFDDWVDQIYDPITKQFDYYKNYTTEIEIIVQDTKGGDIYSLRLFEAFPKNIGDIALDYSNNNIMTITVSFAYKYFLSTQKSGIADNEDLSGALFPNLSNSVKNSFDVGNKYFDNFKKFQSDVSSQLANVIPSSPIANSKAALNRFLSKTKIL